VLEHFTHFLSCYRNASPKLSQISLHTLEEYKQQRVGFVKPSTVNTELNIPKTFFKFAVGCRFARENPVKNLAPCKAPQRKSRFLTPYCYHLN